MGLVENSLDHSRGLDLVRVCHCHELAQRIPRLADSEMDDQGDLSHRQDRSRHAALHALPGPRHLRYASYPTQVEATEFNVAAPDDPVRSALAADFLYRRPAVVCGALDPDAIYQGCLGAACRQCRR